MDMYDLILKAVLAEECGPNADYQECNRRTCGSCRCINLADGIYFQLRGKLGVITTTPKEPR